MGPKVDLTGKTFHRLTVIGLSDQKIRGNLAWRCKCKCGKEVLMTTSHLNENVKHSCGCRGREYHHQSGTHFHMKYREAIKRCNNPNVDSYKYYGGRGIKFEWENFKEFQRDMYDSYVEHVNKYGEKNTSLDRIDSNGNYCKENCRRATIKEQSNNRRNNRYIECCGETLTMTQRAEKIGITVSSIACKLSRGVPMERIVKHPHKRWYSYYNLEEQLKKYI